MDCTERRPTPSGTHSSWGPPALSFAAFVLAHERCAGDVAETRLDDGTLACRCLPCDEVRVFHVGQPSRGEVSAP